jgi:hypothetical protein
MKTIKFFYVKHSIHIYSVQDSQIVEYGWENYRAAFRVKEY